MTRPTTLAHREDVKVAHISQAQDGESLEHVAPAVRGELEPQPRLRIVVVGLDAAVGDLRYEGKEKGYVRIVLSGGIMYFHVLKPQRRDHVFLVSFIFRHEGERQ